MRDGGVAISVTTPAEAERGIRSQRVGVQASTAPGLETVARLAEEGVLTTRVAATFPAERATDAYRADAPRRADRPHLLSVTGRAGRFRMGPASCE